MKRRSKEMGKVHVGYEKKKDANFTHLPNSFQESYEHLTLCAPYFKQGGLVSLYGDYTQTYFSHNYIIYTKMKYVYYYQEIILHLSD